MAKEETIEYIVRMANDMETIENFMGCTGRFVGSMYHVSIKSMAAHIRAQPPQPAVDVEKPDYKSLYEHAMKYIEESPCDPDITDRQSRAWWALQELIQKEGIKQ